MYSNEIEFLKSLFRDSPLFERAMCCVAGGISFYLRIVTLHFLLDLVPKQAERV